MQETCDQAIQNWWQPAHPGWMIFTLNNRHFETLDQIIQVGPPLQGTLESLPELLGRRLVSDFLAASRTSATLCVMFLSCLLSLRSTIDPGDFLERRWRCCTSLKPVVAGRMFGRLELLLSLMSQFPAVLTLGAACGERCSAGGGRRGRLPAAAHLPPSRPNGC